MPDLQPMGKLLIANRGEIAVRIHRTAREMAIDTVGVHPADDRESLHVRTVDESVELAGTGAAAYLDIEQIVDIARDRGCDAIHPGYGFLAENAEFALACEAAGIAFVGPSAEVLRLFGDKVRARDLAAAHGLPVLPGSAVIVGAEQAEAFYEALQPNGTMILKAVAGGGGRGMRVIERKEDIAEALVRGGAEAQAAFGSDALYAERLIERALHIEVQVLGDRHGNVGHLGERDCSIQRRHQKVVEVAPSPQLHPALRKRILEAAVTLAQAAGYDNIGTFEFLVDGADLSDASPFYFIEANPRIQVEHTVTEAVTGVDLVRVQLAIARGAGLHDLGLGNGNAPSPRGHAIQLRINMEKLGEDGVALPRTGTLTAFRPPDGPGVRVDTFGYEGYRTSGLYDSLLAKLIVHSGGPGFADTVSRARRALSEFVIAGVDTNLGVLMNVMDDPDVAAGTMYTRYVDDHLPALLQERELVGVHAQTKVALAGARVDAADPLAVLGEGRRIREEERAETVQDYPDGLVPVRAAMPSTMVSVALAVGDDVLTGQELIVLNAMKMEHVVKAPVSGTVFELNVAEGDTVPEGTVLLVIEEGTVQGEAARSDLDLDLDTPRPDLAEVIRRRTLTTDASRRKQVARRHAQGGRTARENIHDLADEGTFVQYGSLAVGMGLHGTVDELLDYAPSDGLVMGLGHVNGEVFDESRSRCVLMSYDYSVLAGSQGGMNHKMMDRMFQTAAKLSSPLVLFTEGGGGRAGGGSRNARPGRGGSPQISGGGGLNTPSWTLLSKLSGRVPVVGVNAGFCFAGNAVLLGCCDAIIATANSSIGIGGPAMIEGGGLGVYSPEEVGPMSVQIPSGVVDIAVEDEAEAVQATKKYLSYFQGPIDDWVANDQRMLRHVIPENRLRVYDIRELIDILADKDSVLDLRPEFGTAMITALIRIEGRPMGVIANNPAVISGAIDSDAADKAARFMKTCDSFQIPLLLLCDCPGIMVGPEVEKTGLVRHAARMFVIGANIEVPSYMVILRKAYGLGAQAMGGGNQRLPAFVVAWPTSEFGGMGLEGQVKLGQRARLEAIEDLSERQAAYERMVEGAYNRGKGLNAGHVFEVDDVIDPADTRRWIVAGMKANAPPSREVQTRVPFIDAW
ncbi:MAG: HlyD family efflux transporter periplasmic adaptor subunit [Gammaproteobacteria bacterium]|nr:HlyD family efflux transporter periplasmic adaptor subunit [Gammaproteobacteria bacterium]MYF31219.1 HlyD family efflux transporter periplasmic adaptor subunit [Gammaproteobacteria bacterium]MYK45162.1 HlyD family efflux transporter periplasmic adaptor subunit [Gammaproteobacteria bacterium]